MQLTLALLDLPALPATPGGQVDPEARARAVEILARMIAQALQTPAEKDIADE